MSDLPVKKNRNWVALLHQAIDGRDEQTKATIMKACGEGCSRDIIALAERFLGARIETVDQLVAGWNLIREHRGLTGKWEYVPEGIRGIFKDCGCPQKDRDRGQRHDRQGRRSMPFPGKNFKPGSGGLTFSYSRSGNMSSQSPSAERTLMS
jgi:hypothetical protein